MKYKFNYQLTAYELWKLSMYRIYGSMVGASNIIFTIAMILLAVRFGTEANIFFKILIIIGISLFTVIQPLIVYNRAKKQLESFPKDMVIAFDDYGIHIITSNKNVDLKWDSIKGIAKKHSMVIVFSTYKHGYIITNKMLGSDKEDFYKYIITKIENKK